MRPVPGDALGLDRNRLRPRRWRAPYEREIESLRAVVDCLKGALAADNPAAALQEPQSWMVGLTRQERALIGASIAPSPRVVAPDDLIDMLPGHNHPEDRTPKQVAVIVHHVRKKLGESVIQNAWGQGYFMPKAEGDRLTAAAA